MARKTGENKNEKERHSKSSVYFLLRGFFKCHPLIFSRLYKERYIERGLSNQEILSLVDYKDKIGNYTISGDKNLTESVHRKISHTMQNFAWCARFFGCLLWFRRVCKISYNVRNCLSLSPALSPIATPPLDFRLLCEFSA